MSSGNVYPLVDVHLRAQNYDFQHLSRNNNFLLTCGKVNNSFRNSFHSCLFSTIIIIVVFYYKFLQEFLSPSTMHKQIQQHSFVATSFATPKRLLTLKSLRLTKLLAFSFLRNNSPKKTNFPWENTLAAQKINRKFLINGFPFCARTIVQYCDFKLLTLYCLSIWKSICLQLILITLSLGG